MASFILSWIVVEAWCRMLKQSLEHKVWQCSEFCKCLKTCEVLSLRVCSRTRVFQVIHTVLHKGCSLLKTVSGMEKQNNEKSTRIFLKKFTSIGYWGKNGCPSLKLGLSSQLFLQNLDKAPAVWDVVRLSNGSVLNCMDIRSFIKILEKWL